MFNFTSHYRNKINFTWDSLESAKIARNRLKEGVKKHKEGNENISEDIIRNYENKFLEAINDDLNMPQAMSIVWDIVRQNNKSKRYYDLLIKFDKVLGLELDKEEELDIPEEVKELINKRKIARDNKNWEESDKLRDEISNNGYIVKDTKYGMEILKK